MISSIGVDGFTVSSPDFTRAIEGHPVDIFNVSITCVSQRMNASLTCQSGPVYQQVTVGSSTSTVNNLHAATRYAVCVSAVRSGLSSAFGPCTEVTTRGRGTFTTPRSHLPAERCSGEYDVGSK